MIIRKKMISFTSRLQDNSSEGFESNIQRNSRGMSSSNLAATSDTSYFSTSFITLPESNQINPQKGSICFMGDHNTQKMMTSNETRLTIEIANLIISEGLSFDLSQKPRFKEVIDLAIIVLKSYQPPNIKLTSKDILDVFHDQNMERKLSLIKKESDIFGLLFLGDGATISRIPLLNILVSELNFQYTYYNLLIARSAEQMVVKRMEVLYVLDFLRTLEKLILTSQLHMLLCLMELQMYSLLMNR